MKKIILVVVGVILVAVLVRSIWAYQQMKKEEAKVVSAPAIITTTTPEPIQVETPAVVASVVATTTAVKPVVNQVRSEIDKYGVDLYGLKQGVTTVEKTVSNKTKVVYTRNGNLLSIKVPAFDVFGAIESNIRLENPTVAGSSGIDKYGTRLNELKEGETTIEVIDNIKVQAVYTRNADKIEKKVKTTGILGSVTLTRIVDLNSRESLLAEIKKTETSIETDCKSVSTTECLRERRLFLDYLKTKCTIPKTNEEISSCMGDANYNLLRGLF